MTPSPSRRAVLATGAGLAAAPVLAACGDPSTDPQLAQIDPPVKGTEVGLAADVPVGGCHVFARKGTVVTQPVEGEFKAFDAECSHKGCFVGSSTRGFIPCACHGSRFDLVDGAVLAGPAPEPLEEYPVIVRDGRIVMD